MTPVFRGCVLLSAAAMLAALPGICQSVAQPAAGTPAPRFSIYESLEGSPSTLSQTYELDNSARYSFGPRFNLAAGVPLFFTRGQVTSSTGTTSTSSGSGVGDAYLTLNLTPVHGAFVWTTSLTGAAPTGNTSLGLSTGRGLFTWNNHFEHDGDLLSPYVDAGFGNTAPDLRHFIRPYKTLGKVGNFDVGTTVGLTDVVNLDLSGYANLPVGAQKVFSRIAHRGQNGSNFRNGFETTGGASIAQDDGFSTAIEASPRPYLDLSIGFTRSTHLDLNTASFSIGVNVTRLAGWPH